MPHLAIEAGPGSGKTFTLEETYKFILTNQLSGFKPTQEQYDIFVKVRDMVPPDLRPQDIVFVSFNTSTKEKTLQRMPKGTKVYTFNGLGQSMIIKKWKYQEFDNDRSQKLLCEMIGKPFSQCSQFERQEYRNMLNYIGMFKEELLTPSDESISFVQEKYGLDYRFEDITLAYRLMRLMQQPNGRIEYRDQVWLGLQALDDPKRKPFKVALIDEAQDLSALRLEFSLAVAYNCIFCGDPFQSINAFAGADHQAFDKIRKVCKSVLTLKTSFRNPPNHIKHLNTIRPARIVAYKTEDGPIERVELPDLADRIYDFYTYYNKPEEERPVNVPKNLPIRANDLSNYLLIARTNATLIKIGLMLTDRKLPVTLVRREDEPSLTEMLLAYMKSLQPKSIIDLQGKLNTQIRMAESLPVKQSMVLDDKCRSLLAIAEKCSHLNEVQTKLKSLSENKKGSIRASTIHRAKGLEAPFVFIAFPPIHHPKAVTPEQKEQEINLEFVSESRSEYYKCYVVN